MTHVHNTDLDYASSRREEKANLEREALIECLKVLGKIDCVRVSAAASTQYAHWDVVRYECRLSASKGEPWFRPVGRAKPVYRQKRTAQEKASDVAVFEGRVLIKTINKLYQEEVHALLNHVWNNPEVAHIIGVLEMSRS